MRRAFRIALRGLAVCTVLLVLGCVAAYFYLQSDHARELATQQLSRIAGNAITVERIEAGVDSTTVEIRVPDSGADTKSPDASVLPLLSGTVRVNVSPIGLALGRMPTLVQVENARLHLRFDSDGHLLTELPTPPSGAAGSGTIPTITVQNSALTIDQHGRPQFHIDDASLTLTPENDQLKLSGTTSIPSWGEWSIQGGISPTDPTGEVTLATVEPLTANTASLKTLPFIPLETWQEIHVDGRAMAKLTLTVRSGEFGYAVELQPTGTRVKIPAIDLTLNEAAGVVTVHESRVRLTGLTATTAEGRITADGEFHFGAVVPELSLKAVAKGLSVKKLPASWGLPPNLEGKLNGSADLTVILAPDGLKTRGSGRGRMLNARWGGIPIERLDMKLVSGERGYQFQTEQPMSARPAILPEGITSAVLLAVLLQPPPVAPAPEPTYFQANLKLRDVDLEELLSKLEVELPIRIAGKVSVAVKAGIPLNNARELRAYRIDGSITLPELRLQNLTIHKVNAHIRFRDGVLTLTDLSGSITAAETGAKPGTFQGTARLGVDPRTELTARLDVSQLPLGEMTRAFPDLGEVIAGAVTGSLSLRIPADRLDDVTALSAEASLKAEKLTLAQRSVTGLSLKLSVRDGTARLTDAVTRAEGLPITGTASLGLRVPFPFQAKFSASDSDGIALHALVPELNWPVPVNGKLTTRTEASGTVVPFTVQASGSVAAEDLTLGTARVQKFSFNWTATPEVLRIADLAANIYAGTATGSATIPFSSHKSGEFRVELKDVDAAAFTRSVPSTPVKLQGQFNGVAQGTLPRVEAGERPITVKVDMTAPRMRVQGIPTERLQGQLGYKTGAITYSLTGNALGGSFDVNGTYPLKTGKPPAPAPAEPAPKEGASRTSGSARFTNLDLGRLGTALRIPALEPLSGKLNLTLNFTIDAASEMPVGSGRLVIEGFGWGRGNGSRLTSVVRVTPVMIDLTEMTGRFADGEIRAHARYNLANPNRSYFRLTLDRADLAGLLTPVGVTGATGRLSAHLRGQLSGEFHGTGSISGERVTISGVQLGEVRVPLNWAFVPGRGGELDVREAYAAVVGGRAIGTAQVNWNETISVKGTLRLIDLDVVSLLGRVGRGNRANGQVRFAGRNVRSFTDLTASTTIKFRGSGSLFDLPVLRSLAPFLTGVGSFTQARDGELRASLANGIIRIKRFTLESQSASLFTEGTVGAINGRLDLTVVAQTKNIGPPPALMLLLRYVPIAGPIPPGVLIDINRALSNRVIRLNVGGTISRPAVRVNAAQLITENAIRFFLDSYLPFAGNSPQD